MANRYCNLVGSKKISEDFNNINIGFDKVQQDMDSKSSGDHRHPNATDTMDGFMSAADKAKMDASTASATPGTLAQRDASGRLKAATPSAKTDVARKAEVDSVQADLDGHKADATMHVTEADHDKLGSIEEGAEVNQPAFARVNDIEASEKTDALTFKGGVGIKVTTNPATNEVTITASGESTPGDHGSSHTEHGADPIPNATAKEGGLMSAADKAELDKVAVEVPKQAAELEQQGKQLQEHAAELEDHGQRIDVVESDLANVPGTPLELQPGLQIVEADHDTPFRMGEVKGRTEIREGDGIINVKNPYAIVTGGNLLPPFYEWNGGTSGIFLEPYTQKVVSTGDRMNSATQMPAVEGKTYTLRIEREGDGEIGLDFRDDHNNVLWTSEFVKQDNIIATAPQGTAYMNAWTSAPAAGEFIFRNPMLTVGTEPKPFTPQQRSILAFETELAAHPVDGSNPDTLFMGNDGLPYVLEAWEKVTLDGSYTWRVGGTKIAGAKLVATSSNFTPMVGDEIGVKYDGKLLTVQKTGEFTEGDTVNITPNNLYLSIYNSDSGWGPDYTPTADEIKAYFLGWKMYDGQAHGDGTGVYNRTDGLHKAWTPLDSFDGTAYRGVYSGSGTPKELPCTANATYYVKNRHWQPYRLQYLKAKPTIEPVRNYEMGATLSAGLNMVEVASGIVIREKANPTYVNGYGWYINDKNNGATSFLNYSAAEILAVFKGANVDYSWDLVVTPPPSNAQGLARAVIRESDKNLYDPTAIYHVTYTMLDPTLAAPISGTVAANLRGTVSELVQDVGDIGRRLSVVETQKAEKDNAVVWIKPSLINGWEYFGYGATPGYTKIGNVVHIKGKLRNGTPGTAVFRLPSGYRPKEALLFLCRAYDAGNRSVTVGVDPNGDVSVYDLNAEIHLDGTVFIAEQ
ncbi:hypothetical protein WJ0W_006222 [Paenibacillus melissococcoides]|uniref:Tail fiber protein n=1 Tax=Paenibacillus melissococcoides TaxID=2912268 RepID=A0ABM9GAD9_9BACL|nr:MULTISPECIES: hypothetical protein [Paenibacillus]GIO82380.1 hypothetical protein J6TS7_59900 [Paenibacillus dendritiformis]CAH8249035.1 hypothetical protein WJ0W_006222 [Paenibacillus melissococcoides]